MKPKGYKTYKPKEKIKVYSGAPVNQGFYERNLNQAKKLYMTEYDRLKQQIYKRKQDREFHDILDNYYNDYNKFVKKHKFLKNYEDYNKYKEQQTLDFNQYEFKKKNIRALFFKYDNNENDLNFDVTDDIIESMNDGNSMTFLKSMEIKDDYEKRLNGNKKNEINDELNNMNTAYTKQNNINFYIKNEKKEDKDKENEILMSKNNAINNLDDNNINLNTKKTEEYINNDNEINKEENKSNEIIKEEKEEPQEEPEVKEDELTRYKKILIESNYPCLSHLLNPYFNTKYIPPTFIPEKENFEEKEEEKDKEKEKEKEKSSSYNDYNDFEKNSQNKDEENKNDHMPILDDIIKNNNNEEFLAPINPNQGDIKNNIAEEKKEEEENYENEKFEEMNNNDKDNEKEIKNNESQKIKEYNNGELKMLNDIIQDDKFPTFEQIINPYYKTNYQPKEVFPIPEEENEKEYEKENSLGIFEEVTKINKNNINLNKKQQDNNNQKLEDIINNDYKESFAIPKYNESKNEDEINEDINSKNREELKGSLANELNNNNNGNGLVTVDEMINKNFQSNIKQENEEMQKNKEEDDEYNDFLDN